MGSKHYTKAKFYCWLAIHNRLQTKKRIQKWGVTASLNCSLCDNADEDVEHFFSAVLTLKKYGHKFFVAVIFTENHMLGDVKFHGFQGK